MVQSIHPEGHINVNECLYCLHCQVVYSDDHVCPVLIQRQLKRERQAKVSSGGKSQAALRLDELKKKGKAQAGVVTASDQAAGDTG